MLPLCPDEECCISENEVKFESDFRNCPQWRVNNFQSFHKQHFLSYRMAISGAVDGGLGEVQGVKWSKVRVIDLK